MSIVNTTITPIILDYARKLWSYHHMHHSLDKADCILALGSHDLRVAERAAEVFLEGFAPFIVFSGGLGNLTRDLWTKPEAELFAEVAMEKGVPPGAIFMESKSTNSGENILFTQDLLRNHQLNPQRFIVVQKPYMERRSYATFKKHWPDKELIVTSPQISFEEYPNTEIPMERVINIMVGDLQRIQLYPEKGFQVYQHIPGEIWEAYEELIELGFDKHLVK